MITFKQFITESRTKQTSAEELINWADKNAKKYLQAGHLFYRGGSGVKTGSLLIGNSAVVDRPRYSANTVNNYTLWMDNHPSFKGWPKRSLSWIASDDLETAEDFGYDNTHILIVKDKNKVGVVGEKDLWFIELPHIDITIDIFNECTHELINRTCENINELVDALKGYTFDMFNIKIAKTGKDEDALHAMFEYMDSEKLKNLYELWEAVFTPYIFSGYTDAATAASGPSEGEVWVEGEVAFIPILPQNISDEDIMIIYEWSKKYSELHEIISARWEI